MLRQAKPIVSASLDTAKKVPVRQLNPEDWIVYYASREGMGTGEAVQTFVTLGQIKQGDHYRALQTETFSPCRRDVAYHIVQNAPIRPMREDLDFVEGVRFGECRFDTVHLRFQNAIS